MKFQRCKKCSRSVKSSQSSYLNHKLCDDCLLDLTQQNILKQNFLGYVCTRPIKFEYRKARMRKDVVKEIEVGTLCRVRVCGSEGRYFINDGNDINWYGLDDETFKRSFTLMHQLTLF